MRRNRAAPAAAARRACGGAGESAAATAAYYDSMISGEQARRIIAAASGPSRAQRREAGLWQPEAWTREVRARLVTRTRSRAARPGFLVGLGVTAGRRSE